MDYQSRLTENLSQNSCVDLGLTLTTKLKARFGIKEVQLLATYSLHTFLFLCHTIIAAPF